MKYKVKTQYTERASLTKFVSKIVANMGYPTLTFDNEVFSKFAFYSGVVLSKTLLMSAWTARYRIPRRVFMSPEDYQMGGKKVPATFTTDPDVERTRRCHLNDLENVLPFVLVGALYVLTDPDIETATWHFRLFAGFRILHTIAYMFAVPQPTRLIAFAAGFGVTLSMLFRIFRTASW